MSKIGEVGAEKKSSHEKLQSDDVIKINFLKLRDLLGYFEIITS